MTLHVVVNHECDQCGAYFLPYDEDVSCPRCQSPAKKIIPYIERAAESLAFNKQKYGQYTPMGWWVGSLGDHILSVLFGLFDSYEKSAEAEFGKFSEQYLSEVEWRDQEYLQNHIQSIAHEVHRRLCQSD